MGLETATWINQLNVSNPTGTDSRRQGDDHIRLLKTVLKNQFPNLGNAAVTPTATELNRVDGVTSGIQAQLDALDSGKLDASEIVDYARFDTAQVFNQNQRVAGEDLTVAGGQTMNTANFPLYDLNNTGMYRMSITGDFTLQAPNNSANGHFLVILLDQSGGPWNITFSDAIVAWRFPFGVAPDLTQVANANDILVMYRFPMITGFFGLLVPDVKSV